MAGALTRYILSSYAVPAAQDYTISLDICNTDTANPHEVVFMFAAAEVNRTFISCLALHFTASQTIELVKHVESVPTVLDSASYPSTGSGCVNLTVYVIGTNVSVVFGAVTLSATGLTVNTYGQFGFGKTSVTSTLPIQRFDNLMALKYTAPQGSILAASNMVAAATMTAVGSYFGTIQTGAAANAATATMTGAVEVNAPTLQQELYRFRNNDGTVDTATWMFPLNTPALVNPANDIRLRFAVLNTTAHSHQNTKFQLQARVNEGSWAAANTNALDFPYENSFSATHNSAQYSWTSIMHRPGYDDTLYGILIGKFGYSTDRGDSWASVTYDYDYASTGAQVLLRSSTGTLFAIYCAKDLSEWDTQWSQYYNHVYCVYSTNEGVSWSSRVRVDDSTFDMSYSTPISACITDNNTLHVVFANSKTGTELYYHTTSTNGTSWSAETQLTDWWWSGILYPAGNDVDFVTFSSGYYVYRKQYLSGSWQSVVSRSTSVPSLIGYYRTSGSDGVAIGAQATSSSAAVWSYPIVSNVWQTGTLELTDPVNTSGFHLLSKPNASGTRYCITYLLGTWWKVWQRTSAGQWTYLGAYNSAGINPPANPLVISSVDFWGGTTAYLNGVGNRFFHFDYLQWDYLLDGYDSPQLISTGTYQTDNDACEQSVETAGKTLPASTRVEPEFIFKLKTTIKVNDRVDLRLWSDKTPYIYSNEPYLLIDGTGAWMKGGATMTAKVSTLSVNVASSMQATAGMYGTPTGGSVFAKASAVAGATATWVPDLGTKQYAALVASGAATMAATATVPNTAQTHFRVRNDDGTEVTATWIGATDTNVAVDPALPVRVRFAVKNVGQAALSTHEDFIQTSHNGDSWQYVTADSVGVFSGNITGVAECGTYHDTIYGSVFDTLRTPDGRLHFVYFDNTDNGYRGAFYRYTDDGGQTLSTPKSFPVPPTLYFPDGTWFIVDLSVVEHAVGQLLVFCVIRNMSADFQSYTDKILAWWSNDNGLTWGSTQEPSQGWKTMTGQFKWVTNRVRGYILHNYTIVGFKSPAYAMFNNGSWTWGYWGSLLYSQCNTSGGWIGSNGELEAIFVTYYDGTHDGFLSFYHDGTAASEGGYLKYTGTSNVITLPVIANNDRSTVFYNSKRVETGYGAYSGSGSTGNFFKRTSKGYASAYADNPASIGNPGGAGWYSALADNGTLHVINGAPNDGYYTRRHPRTGWDTPTSLSSNYVSVATHFNLNHELTYGNVLNYALTMHYWYPPTDNFIESDDTVQRISSETFVIDNNAMAYDGQFGPITSVPVSNVYEGEVLLQFDNAHFTDGDTVCVRTTADTWLQSCCLTMNKPSSAMTAGATMSAYAKVPRTHAAQTLMHAWSWMSARFRLDGAEATMAATATMVAPLVRTALSHASMQGAATVLPKATYTARIYANHLVFAIMTPVMRIEKWVEAAMASAATSTGSVTLTRGVWASMDGAATTVCYPTAIWSISAAAAGAAAMQGVGTYLWQVAAAPHAESLMYAGFEGIRRAKTVAASVGSTTVSGSMTRGVKARMWAAAATAAQPSRTRHVASAASASARMVATESQTRLAKVSMKGYAYIVALPAPLETCATVVRWEPVTTVYAPPPLVVTQYTTEVQAKRKAVEVEAIKEELEVYCVG